MSAFKVPRGLIPGGWWKPSVSFLLAARTNLAGLLENERKLLTKLLGITAALAALGNS
jgi:hypothetical protein